MARRRSQRDESCRRSASGEDVAADVRAAARSIAERIGDHPAVDYLADDAGFLRIGRSLVEDDVPLATIERLSHSSNALVAAIADRALARREKVSDEWLVWAFRRL